MMKKPIDSYLKTEDLEDSAGLERLSENLIEKAKSSGMLIEEDAKMLKHTMTGDLKKKIPPQIYQIISEVICVLEKVDENEDQ